MQANVVLPNKATLPPIVEPPAAPADQNPLLRLKQAAKYLGVSEKTLKRAEERGDITFERTPGGHHRIRLQALENARVLEAGKAAALSGLPYGAFRRGIRKAEPGKSAAAASGFTVRRYYSYAQAKALGGAIRTQKAATAVQGVLARSVEPSGLVLANAALAATKQAAERTEAVVAKQVRFRLVPTRAKKAQELYRRSVGTILLVLKSRNPDASKEEIVRLAVQAMGDQRAGEAVGGSVSTIMAGLAAVKPKSVMASLAEVKPEAIMAGLAAVKPR